MASVVGHDELLNLATQMDGLADQACHVLDQYFHLHTELQSTGQLKGAAGSANVNTVEQVHEAQTKVQNAFRNVTDVLRGNAAHYQNTDEHNASLAQQVAANAGTGLAHT
jgi:WXG100 family type VII secretion target